MKTISSRYSFTDILHLLATKNPEEKLRIAFQLNAFVAKIQKTGESYGKSNQRHRTRATS